MANLILIVEDHQLTLEALQSLMTAEGFAVETAESGEQAIEKIALKKYDAVILDIMLPRVDGFEVCRRIKAEPKNMGTPVIMLTALDVPDIGTRSAEAGANDVILKPFEPEDLIARLKKLL